MTNRKKNVVFVEKFCTIIRSPFGKRRKLLKNGGETCAQRLSSGAFIDVINRDAAQWEEAACWEFIKIERLENPASSTRINGNEAANGSISWYKGPHGATRDNL